MKWYDDITAKNATLWHDGISMGFVYHHNGLWRCIVKGIPARDIKGDKVTFNNIEDAKNYVQEII